MITVLEYQLMALNPSIMGARLHTSRAARQSAAVGAKLAEIDGRVGTLEAAAERRHDGGADVFDRSMAAVESDCAWADRAIKTIDVCWEDVP